MTTFQALTAFYQARNADAVLVADLSSSDADLEASGEAVRLAIDEVGRCVPATRAEADALLRLAVELARADAWEGPQAAIRASVAAGVPDAA